MSEEFEQKKEFLQREEVKTMQKDIAKLREAEAQKERERVAGLKPGGKIPAKQPIEQENNKDETKPVIGDLIPKSPPKKSGSFKKILIRTLIVLTCFLALGSFIWFFIIRKPLPKQVIIQEPIVPTEEPPIEEPLTEELPTEEPLVVEKPTAPLHIIEKIVDWGYSMPKIPRTIDTIIIHSVYNTLGEDVHNVEMIIQQYKTYRVIGHYLIARDGTVIRLAPNKAIAYHAGVSRMPDNSRVNVINNFSIGIIIINTKTESPAEIQYQSLSQLVKLLRQEYNIPFENILGHNTIAPGRETGPWNFNWDYFSALITN